MLRTQFALVLSLLCLLISVDSLADDVSGQTGVGMELGMMKLVGGWHDYSNIDQELGLHLRRGFHPNWSGQLALNFGWLHPKDDVPEANHLRVPGLERLYSVRYHGRLDALYHISPDKRTSPFLGLGLGATQTKVKDMRGKDSFGGLFPGGPTLYGFNEDGDSLKLKSTQFTLSFTAGLDYFVTSTVAINLGARYHMYFGNNLDNIGLSNSDIYGREHVDANKALVEGFLGFTWFFGKSDRDGDGIKNSLDACPDSPEDYDNHQDVDGCPDPDNDGDSIFDTIDQCPDTPEDFDGFQDGDGCPDLDNDGDGIPDDQDDCRNEAEDFDGFMDEDGCPDFDNDADGVPDSLDVCPDTPEGLEVDEQGCPVVTEIGDNLVLEGVTFMSSSAELSPESAFVLDRVVESLLAYPNVLIEVQGHTDSHGKAGYNKQLSAQRAESVRAYLIDRSVGAERVTAMGYGERYPIASNLTAEGRALNRRVELHRID